MAVVKLKLALQESKVELFVKAGEDFVPVHATVDAASLSRYLGSNMMAHADFDVKSKGEWLFSLYFSLALITVIRL